MARKQIKEFKPSAGNEKWMTSKIPEEWQQVKNTWADANNHAHKAVELFMNTGDLLLVLRESLPGDREFGTARREFVPELSRNDAYRAMGMARNRERFAIPEGSEIPSISVFAELINSSDELVEQVKEQVADPDVKSPTVKEVRKQVKAESAADFEKAITGSENEQTVQPSGNWTETASIDVEQEEKPKKSKPEPTLAEWFNMTVQARIKKLKKRQLDHEIAHIILGINPHYDGDCPMSIDLFLLIAHEYQRRWKDEGYTQAEQDKIQECIDIIREDCYD